MSRGTWTGTDPITFTYQWRRCNAAGNGCGNIAGATAQTYLLRPGDAGHRLRVRVTGRNADGDNQATSVSTAVNSRPSSAPPADGCPSGTGTINVSNLSAPERLNLDRYESSPSVIGRSTGSLTIRFHVSACNGRSVQGALVYAAAAPIGQFSIPGLTPTGAGGWAPPRGSSSCSSSSAAPRSRARTCWAASRRGGSSRSRSTSVAVDHARAPLPGWRRRTPSGVSRIVAVNAGRDVRRAARQRADAAPERRRAARSPHPPLAVAARAVGLPRLRLRSGLLRRLAGPDRVAQPQLHAATDLAAAKGDSATAFAWTLEAFWLVKLTIAALIHPARDRGDRGRAPRLDANLWRTLVVLRVPIAVVAFFGVLLFAPVASQQFDDLIRRWIGPDWNELVVTVVLTFVLSAVIAAVYRRLVLLQQEPLYNEIGVRQRLPSESGMLAMLLASFTTTYLTLTSIIQGVALAYLVSVVDEELHTFELANWLLVAATFLMIVAAWYEYMNAVTVFVWIPRLRDALIPFLLGGAELVLIRTLRSQTALQASYLAIGLIALVVLLAFLNMYSSAASEGGPNQRLLAELGTYHRLNIAFVVLAGLSILGFAGLEAWLAESSQLDVATAACSLAFVVAFLVRGALYWGRVIEIARRDGA